MPGREIWGMRASSRTSRTTERKLKPGQTSLLLQKRTGDALVIRHPWDASCCRPKKAALLSSRGKRKDSKAGAWKLHRRERPDPEYECVFFSGDATRHAKVSHNNL